MDAAIKSLKGARYHFNIGDYRGAISRAYYASFYAVSAVLLTEDQSYKKHSAVIAAFNRGFIKIGIFDSEIVRKYRSLFDLRQLSDYDLITVIDEKGVNESLLDGREIVNTLLGFCEVWLKEKSLN